MTVGVKVSVPVNLFTVQVHDRSVNSFSFAVWPTSTHDIVGVVGIVRHDPFLIFFALDHPDGILLRIALFGRIAWLQEDRDRTGMTAARPAAITRDDVCSELLV